MSRRSHGFLIDVLRQCDYILLGLCLVCSAFGLVMIASATRYMGSMRYVAVQAAATALGVILYILMSSVDLPEMTKKGWKWILIANFVLILLLRTPFGAADDTGNRAWLKFPFLPVMVQPAELVKIGYILLLAKQLSPQLLDFPVQGIFVFRPVTFKILQHDSVTSYSTVHIRETFL